MKKFEIEITAEVDEGLEDLWERSKRDPELSRMFLSVDMMIGQLLQFGIDEFRRRLTMFPSNRAREPDHG